MQTAILGIRSGGGGEEVAIKASRDGDMRIAQYLPPYAMLAAAGKVFAVDMSGGTAQAPSVAPVTTTAEWTLYNANDTKHIVLLFAASIMLDGIAGVGHSIMIAAAKGAQTVVNSNYAGTIITCTDGSQNKPNFYLDNNTTLVGGTPSWLFAASYDQLAVDGVGEGVVVWIDGYVVAPPGGSICIQPVGETGTAGLYSIQMFVAEVEMD